MKKQYRINIPLVECLLIILIYAYCTSDCRAAEPTPLIPDFEYVGEGGASRHSLNFRRTNKDICKVTMIRHYEIVQMYSGNCDTMYKVFKKLKQQMRD